MMRTVEEMNRLQHRKYLGDGAYASTDGFHIILSTENGIHAENIIYLDDRVLDSFMRYLEERMNVKIRVEKKSPDNQVDGPGNIP